MKLRERPGEQPGPVEDQPPRVDLHEVARPQRQGHRQQDGGLRLRRGDARGVVRQGECQHHVGDGHRRGDADRAEGDDPVHRRLDERLEVLQPEPMHHRRAQGVQAP